MAKRALVQRLIRNGIDVDKPICSVQSEFRCLPFFYGSHTRVRGFNVLKEAGCRTLGDVEALTPRSLVLNKQVGANTVKDIVAEYSDVQQKLESLVLEFDNIVDKEIQLEGASIEQMLVSWARERGRK